MRENLIHHQILLDYVIINKSLQKPNEWPIRRDVLIRIGSDRKSERSFATNFLTAYKYLVPTNESRHEELYMTPKGFEALNSQYFIHEDKKYLWERSKHRWTLAFGLITAFGVFVPMVKDCSSFAKPNKKQELHILIREYQKITPVLNPPKKSASSNSLTNPTIVFPK